MRIRPFFYKLVNIVRLSRTSPKAVIPKAARFKKSESSAASDLPGPGSYNVEAVRDRLARTSIKPVIRKHKTKLKPLNDIGPGEYDVLGAKQKLAKYNTSVVIPRAKKKQAKSLEVPGPGHYDTVLAEERTVKKTTCVLFKRYKTPIHVMKPEIAHPGPAQYDVRRSYEACSSARRCGGVVKFGTGREAPIRPALRV